MSTHELDPEFLTRLREIFGAERLLTDPAECWVYGQDNSRHLSPPAAVALAVTEQEVVELVRECRSRSISLTVRGRGTGTAGGAVPYAGGVVLSLERMDRILSTDPANRVMVVEAGVLNQTAQDAAAEHGFFWPPDPTSAAFCTIGGNAAVNAAGPRALKYGTTRDNVLGLKAVTGAGESIQTGVYTTKGVVGYDLTRLLIGSEGTLAIITELTLKLAPLPEAIRTLRVAYQNISHAAEAVSAVMGQATIPRSLEFMDARAISMAREYAGADLPEGAGAMLMIEVDGPLAGLDAAVEAVSRAASNDGLVDLRQAQTAEEAAQLWAARKALSPALRTVAPNKLNEDVVVPVSRIPNLIDGLETISRRYGITIVNFGHAGNGNIHVNLLYDSQDPEQQEHARPCLDAVFDLVLSLGGTLSGEHGIGREKRDYINREIDPETLDLMRRIRHEFDPAGILNPGKIFPEANGEDRS
ncbi:MAG: FAD-linked oxidase C-terminal domain-containing protein [Acidiferrobacteraceae bacterium]